MTGELVALALEYREARLRLLEHPEDPEELAEVVLLTEAVHTAVHHGEHHGHHHGERHPRVAPLPDGVRG